jgi:hypothetical protein
MYFWDDIRVSNSNPSQSGLEISAELQLAVVVYKYRQYFQYKLFSLQLLDAVVVVGDLELNRRAQGIAAVLPR